MPSSGRPAAAWPAIAWRHSAPSADVAPKCPTPGTTIADGEPRSEASRTTRASAATAPERLPDRRQVARAVVHDRDHSSSFVLGSMPAELAVLRAGDAERAAERLERRLDPVMRRTPVEDLHVDVAAHTAGEPVEEVGHQLRLEVADARHAHAERHDGVRAAAEVERRHGQRLVHRHDEVAGPVDARAACRAPRSTPRPSAMPTSSTVWCWSTSRSPLARSSRSNTPWRATSSSMWSRNRMPVDTRARPRPSMRRRTRMSVSAVFRATTALRTAPPPSPPGTPACAPRRRP